MSTGFKQILSIIIIISIIIVLDFILANYTKNNVKKINEKLLEIDKLVEEEKDFEMSNKMAKELLEEWEMAERILSCYIEHDEIEKVSDKINLICKQIRIESYSDARQTISETEFLLKHIENKQSVTIENFF